MKIAVRLDDITPDMDWERFQIQSAFRPVSGEAAYRCGS